MFSLGLRDKGSDTKLESMAVAGGYEAAGEQLLRLAQWGDTPERGAGVSPAPQHQHFPSTYGARGNARDRKAWPAKFEGTEGPRSIISGSAWERRAGFSSIVLKLSGTQSVQGPDLRLAGLDASIRNYR